MHNTNVYYVSCDYIILHPYVCVTVSTYITQEELYEYVHL